MVTRVVAPTLSSFLTSIYRPSHSTVVLTGLRSITWLFLSNICQANHMVIPEYPLKIFATEITQIDSQNSNHFSFSPNHMVLIPLLMLKQPFIGIKPFIWDRNTTGISIAGCESLADYYHKQFQWLYCFTYGSHTLMQVPLFGEAAFLSFFKKIWTKN